VGRRQANLAAGGIAAAFVAYVSSVGDLPRNQLGYARVVDTPLRAELNHVAPGGRVLALSSTVAPLHPALNYAGATQTLRFTDTWPLRAAYRTCIDGVPRYHPPAAMGAAERFLHDTTIADFLRAPPDAVIVDSNPRIPDCGGAFSYLGYFRREPGFAAAFAAYRKHATVGQFDVWVRGDQPTNRPSPRTAASERRSIQAESWPRVR
jgi:hypothetical protein